MSSNSNQPPQPSDDRRATSLSEQFAISNSTANAFLGRKRPAWLISGVTPAPTPRERVEANAAAVSMNTRTATAPVCTSPPNMLPVRRKAAITKAPKATSAALALPPPSSSIIHRKGTSINAQTAPMSPHPPSLQTVLPSPAPSNESSSAIALDSPSRAALSLIHMVSPSTSSVPLPTQSQPDNTRSGPSSTGTFALQITASPTCQTSPNTLIDLTIPTQPTAFPAGQQPPQQQFPQHPQQPLSMSGSVQPTQPAQPAQPTQPTQPAQVEQPGQPGQHRCSPTLTPYITFKPFMATILSRFGGTKKISSEVENPRFRVLEKACNANDGFFIALHQLYCMWSVRRGEVHAIFGNENSQIVDNGFDIIEDILRPNNKMRTKLVQTLANFPAEFRNMMNGPYTYALVVPQISLFLKNMCMHWSNVCDSIVQRGYPFLMDELVGYLGCVSEALQLVLFTTSRRRLDVSDSELSACMECWFLKDQKTHKTGPGSFQVVAYNSIAELEQHNAYLIYAYRHLITVGIGPWDQVNPMAAALHLPPVHPSLQTPQHTMTSQLQQSQPSLVQLHEQQQLQTQIQVHRHQQHQLLQQLNQLRQLRQLRQLQEQPQQAQEAQPVQSAQPMQQIRQMQQMQQVQQLQVQRQIPTPFKRPAPSPIIIFSNATTSRVATPIATSAASPMPQSGLRPSTRQPTSASFFPAAGHILSRSEYPHDPMDRRSLSIGLNEALLKSPVRVIIDLPAGKRLPGGAKEERYYQSVDRMVVEPTRTPKGANIRVFEFEVTKEDLAALVTRFTPANELLPAERHFQGSLRYRLRSCKAPSGDKSMTESEWVVANTTWPINIFINFNGKVVTTRRQAHNGKDLAAELTTLVRAGTNRLQIVIPKPSQENGNVSDCILGVEVIKTAAHRTLREEIVRDRTLPARATLDEIKRRLMGSLGDDDDGLAMVQSDLSVDLADPFSATIFGTPARGVKCRHIECFDLDNWLNTRPRSPIFDCQHRYGCSCVGQKQKDGILHSAPTLPDKWRCPICSGDARPKSLCIDGFLVDVRAQLEKEGNLGRTKSIQVASDGTWKAVLQEEEAEEGEAEEGDEGDENKPPGKRGHQDKDMAAGQPARKVSRTVSASTASRHRKASQIEVIELD